MRNVMKTSSTSVSLSLDGRGSRVRVTSSVDKRKLIPYKKILYRDLSGRNSAVECQLPKLDVAGSTPVARSKTSPENPASCDPQILEILAENEKSSQNVPISDNSSPAEMATMPAKSIS